MFLNEVSRFGFLKFITVRQILSSLKLFLKLFSAPFRFSRIHYEFGLQHKTVLQHYSCFIDLISTPYAYWIGRKDHICWHNCGITLGTPMHIHVHHNSALFEFRQFQTLAVPVKIPHTTSSVSSACNQLCGNSCWARELIISKKSSGSSQIDFWPFLKALFWF